MNSRIFDDRCVKRKSASCSQYQSEDSSVRSRNRPSPSRSAASACLSSLTSVMVPINPATLPSALLNVALL